MNVKNVLDLHKNGYERVFKVINYESESQTTVNKIADVKMFHFDISEYTGVYCYKYCYL